MVRTPPPFLTWPGHGGRGDNAIVTAGQRFDHYAVPVEATDLAVDLSDNLAVDFSIPVSDGGQLARSLSSGKNFFADREIRQILAGLEVAYKSEPAEVAQLAKRLAPARNPLSRRNMIRNVALDLTPRGTSSASTTLQFVADPVVNFDGFSMETSFGRPAKRYNRNAISAFGARARERNDFVGLEVNGAMAGERLSFGFRGFFDVDSREKESLGGVRGGFGNGRLLKESLGRRGWDSDLDGTARWGLVDGQKIIEEFEKLAERDERDAWIDATPKPDAPELPTRGDLVNYFAALTSAPQYYGRPSFNGNQRVFTDLVAYAPGMSSSAGRHPGGARSGGRSAVRQQTRIGRPGGPEDHRRRPSGRMEIAAYSADDAKPVGSPTTARAATPTNDASRSDCSNASSATALTCGTCTRRLGLGPSESSAGSIGRRSLDLIPDLRAAGRRPGVRGRCQGDRRTDRRVGPDPAARRGERRPRGSKCTWCSTDRGSPSGVGCCSPTKRGSDGQGGACSVKCTTAKPRGSFARQGQGTRQERTPDSSTATAAPNLKPDVSELVVLPLPLRSREHVYRELGHGARLGACTRTRTPASSICTKDAPCKLLACEFAADNGQNVGRHLGHLLRQKDDDHRTGFFTLMAAPRTRARGSYWHSTRSSRRIRSDPLVRYLWQMHDDEHPRLAGALRLRAGSRGRGHVPWQADDLPPHLRPLAGRVHQPRPVGPARRANASGRSSSPPRNADNVLGWCTLAMVQDRCPNAAAWKSVADAWAVLAEKSALRYPALYEEARCLGNAGQHTDLAQKKYQELFRGCLEGRGAAAARFVVPQRAGERRTGRRGPS